ncbi:hypothetical protein DYST_01898 [Dyella terrae]|nr:hypothetical protein DYST_01898 [Dyella terrae]
MADIRFGPEADVSINRKVVVQNPLKTNLKVIDTLLADPVPPIRCTPPNMQFARQIKPRELGPTECAMVMIVTDGGLSPFAMYKRDAD